MPALAPYIPNQDAKLNLWLQNFATLTSATPAAYGLSAGDATSIASIIASWTLAYSPVTSPTTKTAAAVSTKNTSKVTTLAQIRVYAQQISLNPGVSSDNKIALGLNPRTSTPSPISAPTSTPVLTVQSASALAIILRYRDSAGSPSTKGKPYGVKQCVIRYAISATPITDVAMLTGLVLATKSPLTVQFLPGDGGKQAYFAAQWSTQSAKVSGFSPIISFTIPVGS